MASGSLRAAAKAVAFAPATALGATESAAERWGSGAATIALPVSDNTAAVTATP